MADVCFIKENKNKNFTVINNIFLRDERLSWKAKGVFTYILSLPDDWKIYMSELQTHASDGKSSLQQAIKELVSFGYIEKLPMKDKGRFAGYAYKIIENPSNRSRFSATEKPQRKNRLRENRNGETATENQPLLNTYIPNTYIPNTEEINIEREKELHSQDFSNPSFEQMSEQEKAWTIEQQPKAFSDEIFNVFKTGAMPCANGNDISFLMRDFKNGMAKIRKDYSYLAHEEIIKACKNYVAIVNSPQTYLNTKLSFERFVQMKNFADFLPANFIYENFISFDKKKQYEEEKQQQQQQQQQQESELEYDPYFERFNIGMN